jgi:hypothetical protein
LEAQNEHPVETRGRFWTFAQLPREMLILKNYNLNKDEIEDQTLYKNSKFAQLPREIVVFAPEQHVVKQ